MSTRFSQLYRKLKERGPFWFLSRLMDKAGKKNSFWLVLLSPFISLIYYLLLYPILRIRGFSFKPSDINSKKLFLFYDLDVSPVTYDFNWSLTLAEDYRKKMGLESIHVVFVPGRKNGFRPEYEEYESRVDTFSRSWRLNEVLYPLSNLLPSCNGLTFCSSREEAAMLCEQVRPNIYPQHYSVTFPVAHAINPRLKHGETLDMPLRAPLQARRYIKEWFDACVGNRKLITITLRTSAYMPTRNSNFAAWLKFAEQLDNEEYCVVFVPDTDTAFLSQQTELKDYICFNEACWNVGLRSALYEMAYLNMGVNNGTMSLCWLNQKCHYITFKIQVESVTQATSAELQSHGFVIGESLPFAGPYQKWVWEDDTFEVIMREFRRMESILNKETVAELVSV